MILEFLGVSPKNLARLHKLVAENTKRHIEAGQETNSYLDESVWEKELKGYNFKVLVTPVHDVAFVLALIEASGECCVQQNT